MVVTWMSHRNQASMPMLSAARVSATTPLGARSVSYGSTRCAAASLGDWWMSGTTPISGVKVSLRHTDGRPMTQVDVEGTKLDVEDTFCYLGDMLCCGGGCDSAIADRCLGKVQETTVCPHLQAPLSRGVWQVIHGLCPLSYAPR